MSPHQSALQPQKLFMGNALYVNDQTAHSLHRLHFEYRLWSFPKFRQPERLLGGWFGRLSVGSKGANRPENRRGIRWWQEGKEKQVSLSGKENRKSTETGRNYFSRFTIWRLFQLRMSVVEQNENVIQVVWHPFKMALRDLQVRLCIRGLIE